MLVGFKVEVAGGEARGRCNGRPTGIEAWCPVANPAIDDRRRTAVSRTVNDDEVPFPPVVLAGERFALCSMDIGSVGPLTRFRILRAGRFPIRDPGPQR
jgi:hypothetical protein